jgi:hypothetical protein
VAGWQIKRTLKLEGRAAIFNTSSKAEISVSPVPEAGRSGEQLRDIDGEESRLLFTPITCL